LKQVDPLSPFLFILVMESLHLSFKRVEEVGMFNGIKINSSMTLSHMFYADDAIFMGQWSKRNIDTLMYMLKCFERASGLSINFSKSKFIGLAVSIKKVEEVTRHIGCGILNTPFSFLGSKVGGCMSRIKSWDEVIDKMVNHLSKWKMKTLPIGGRLTLLKAVFGSMPIYHMSIFKVPMVIHAIHGVDGRIGRAGNVGYTSIWCDIIKEMDRMPRSDIESEQRDHLLDSLEGVMLNPSEARWSWDLNGSEEFSVASARRSSLRFGAYFTYEEVKRAVWNCGTNKSPGQMDFSLNFAVDFEKAFDSVKWDYLDETLKAFGFGSKWRNWISSCLNNAMGSVLVNGSPTLEFQFHKGLKQGGVDAKRWCGAGNNGLLCSKVADLVLPNISDRWCWSLEGSQEFSVKSSRILIDNTILPKAEFPTRWLRVVPIKDNRCNRKVAFNKLKEELCLVDDAIDKGVGTEEVVNKRVAVLNSL
nr:RNA-directed DNA polymerase, eukaryota [Tanacetum cinerariifolium]